MAYIIKAKPNGMIVARAVSKRDARVIISTIESIDLREDRFEPDTYYIEEVSG